MQRSRYAYGRLWHAVGAAMVAAVVVVSLVPLTFETQVEQGDKLGHFVAYGTLMFWFGMLTAGRARIGSAAALAATGIALEYAQAATGYRSFEVADMLANATGVAIGWVVAVTPAGRLLGWVDRWLSGKRPGAGSPGAAQRPE